MPNLVLATIRDEVRADCGKPSITELPDANIDSKIADSVQDFSERAGWVRDKIGSITTVADQQSYTPAETDFGRLKDVYWTGESALTIDSRFSTDIPNVQYALPVGDLDFRSLNLIQEMKRKELKHSALGPKWDFFGGKIYLDPAPTKAGLSVKFLYVPDGADVTTIDDSYGRHIKARAAWYVLQQLIARRANKGTADREGIQARMNLPELKNLVEQKEALWERLMLTVR